MALKNKATLTTDKNNQYADNNSGDITPAVIRSQQEDIIDSNSNLAETAIQTFDGEIAAPDMRIVGQGPVIEKSRIVVNQLSDFEPVTDEGDGPGHYLGLNTKYTFGVDISLSDPVFITGITDFEGNGSLTFVGAGPFVKVKTGVTFGLFAIRDMRIIGTGQLFDISAPIVVKLQDATIDGFNVGSIAALFVVIELMSFEFITGGLTIIGTDFGGGAVTSSTYINSLFVYATPISDTLITYQGTFSTIQLAHAEVRSLTGDFALDIDSSIVVGSLDAIGVNLEPLGGTVFAPGSLDQTDPRFQFTTVRGISDSIAFVYLRALNQGATVTTLTLNIVSRITGIFTDAVERFTTDAIGNAIHIGLSSQQFGVMATIHGTVSSGTKISFNFYLVRGNTLNTITGAADGGGGQVVITTSLAHGYSNGDRIIHEDTSSYNGEFTISNVTTNTYEITDAFVVTETGNHYKVQINSKASTDFTSGTDSNISLITELELQPQDKVFLGVENVGSGANYLLSNIQEIIK